jgi:pimeloyl-ACP methyl ester carboxylesterase
MMAMTQKLFPSSSFMEYYTLLSCTVQNLYFSNRPRVLFDIQGHGNSPVPDTPSTPSTFAADIKEILEHVGFARADVVGHAGECTIGIQFATEFPEKVRRLVLMAPPPLPMPRDGIAKFVSIIRESGAQPMGQWMESCLGNKCKNDSEVRARCVGGC